jgi:hypothetical protein
MEIRSPEQKARITQLFLPLLDSQDLASTFHSFLRVDPHYAFDSLYVLTSYNTMNFTTMSKLQKPITTAFIE